MERESTRRLTIPERRAKQQKRMRSGLLISALVHIVAIGGFSDETIDKLKREARKLYRSALEETDITRIVETLDAKKPESLRNFIFSLDYAEYGIESDQIKKATVIQKQRIEAAQVVDGEKGEVAMLDSMLSHYPVEMHHLGQESATHYYNTGEYNCVSKAVSLGSELAVLRPDWYEAGDIQARLYSGIDADNDGIYETEPHISLIVDQGDHIYDFDGETVAVEYKDSSEYLHNSATTMELAELLHSSYLVATGHMQHEGGNAVGKDTGDPYNYGFNLVFPYSPEVYGNAGYMQVMYIPESEIERARTFDISDLQEGVEFDPTIHSVLSSDVMARVLREADQDWAQSLLEVAATSDVAVEPVVVDNEWVQGNRNIFNAFVGSEYYVQDLVENALQPVDYESAQWFLEETYETPVIVNREVGNAVVDYYEEIDFTPGPAYTLRQRYIDVDIIERLAPQVDLLFIQTADVSKETIDAFLASGTMDVYVSETDTKIEYIRLLEGQKIAELNFVPNKNIPTEEYIASISNIDVSRITFRGIIEDEGNMQYYPDGEFYAAISEIEHIREIEMMLPAGSMSREQFERILVNTDIVHMSDWTLIHHESYLLQLPIKGLGVYTISEPRTYQILESLQMQELDIVKIDSMDTLQKITDLIDSGTTKLVVVQELHCIGFTEAEAIQHIGNRNIQIVDSFLY